MAVAGRYEAMTWMKLGMVTAVFILAVLVLVACSAAVADIEPAGGQVQVIASGTIQPATQTTPTIELPDMGPAPEILNEVWINTDTPQTLASLRGKVVLLEFWTFG